MGGQLVATATDGANSSASVTAYVVGSPIPNNQITTQLTNLYNPGFQGYTPQLLCLIALQESGYAQFSTKQPSSLYGVNARWPIENFATSTVPAGSYIGLMQVAVTMATAWDWKQNTAAGNAVFMNKLTTLVLPYQTATLQANPGLPAMTGQQIEDSVLVFYGGFVDHSVTPAQTLRYYIPGTVNGQPAWVINPADSLMSGECITPTQYIYGGGTNCQGQAVIGVRQQTIPN